MGTVKLGHFSQASALFGEKEDEINADVRGEQKCRTPVGREEFMCFEKVGFPSFLLTK